MRATPQQLADLSAELVAVVDVWRRRCADEAEASSPKDSAPALIALYAVPVQP